MKSRTEIKAERDRLWEEHRKKNLRPAKEIVKMEKPSMRYDEKGKPIMKYPWGQELPAGSCETYFWELLQDIKKNMTAEAVEKYCAERPVSDDDTDITVLKGFVSFVLQAAEASVEKRDKEREEEIEEVRIACGLHEPEEVEEDDEEP